VGRFHLAASNAWLAAFFAALLAWPAWNREGQHDLQQVVCFVLTLLRSSLE